MAAVVALGACTSPADQPGASTPATAVPATAPSGPPLRAIGFDQERIALALVVDISGPGRQRGSRLVEAADAFWAGVAAEGGIGGQFPVELVVLDSAGDGDVARRALSEVVNDVAAVAIVDDPAVAGAIRPVLADQGMVAVSADPAPGAYTDQHRLPVGLGDGDRIGALAELLDAEGEGSGRWCPVGADGPAMTSLVEGLTAAEPAAPVADPVVVGPDTDVGEVVASLAECGVVWLPRSASERDRILVSLAAAEHPGTVAVPADEMVLPVGTASWAAGRLVLGTNGPDWSAPTPAVERMLAVVGEHSPDLDVGSTTALGWAAQEVVAAVLEAAFELGTFDRASLLEIAADLPPLASVVSTWTAGPDGQRSPAGSMVAMTPGAEGVAGADGGEELGVVDIGPPPD